MSQRDATWFHVTRAPFFAVVAAPARTSERHGPQSCLQVESLPAFTIRKVRSVQYPCMELRHRHRSMETVVGCRRSVKMCKVVYGSLKVRMVESDHLHPLFEEDLETRKGDLLKTLVGQILSWK